MRGRDKKKKRGRGSPPPLPRRNPEQQGSSNATDVHLDLTHQADDYGFLESRKCLTTKAAVNEVQHNKRKDMIKQRHSEVAQQYGSVILKIKSNQKQKSRNHSYDKQTMGPHSSNTDNSQSMREADTKYNTLSFYPKHIVERQSRSRSRSTCLSHREPDNETNTQRSDRSRSKSRDIIALYTSSGQNSHRSRSSTPAGSLGSYLYTPSERAPSSHRSRSCTPARSLQSYQFYPQSKTPTNISRASTPAYAVPHQIIPHSSRSRSLARLEDRGARNRSQSTEPFSRAKSESRCHSRNRDAISLCSNLSTQSRALSNSEIASQNLELWMSTSSKLQRPSSQTRKPKKEKQNETFVTLLEMDPDVNEKLENLLNKSHSLKPANVKMMMIAGHNPAGNDWESKDEIQVKPGAIITGLYKQNEWLFIKTDSNKSGFVPYAYTKAVKVTAITNLDNTTAHRKEAVPLSRSERNSADSSNSNSGILKKKPDNKVLPHPSRNTTMPSIKPNRDSVSSNNSVFLEDLMVTRPASFPARVAPQQSGYADCLVVDTDHKYDGIEDIRAYCSDSGISEPNSNHSDEIDSIASPGRPPIVTPGSRSSLEFADPRHLDPNISRSHRNHSDSELVRQTHQQKPKREQISFMPLGPLGERLQGQRRDNSSPLYVNNSVYNYLSPPSQHTITLDMRARAHTSQNIPAELKPEIPKDYNGPRVRVVYAYSGDNDDDVNVFPGEMVTVLNGEDSEWIWVQKRNGTEGFIPREYALPLDGCRPKVKKNHHHMVVAL